MSFGITKTIPASRGDEGIESLFDGSLTEFEFHMARKPVAKEGHRGTRYYEGTDWN